MCYYTCACTVHTNISRVRGIVIEEGEGKLPLNAFVFPTRQLIIKTLRQQLLTITKLKTVVGQLTGNY